ncbi:MAG TPA: hypothetical protein PK629_11625 [Oscillospiraceae bacterium]|nr:hypothetical protein [Oscillospiraceae bacterium]HPF56001.1 hypothetical protein [Clostridiales bacterium]HPK36337.1 hypothetical protein [Oscillospiraceae bacterium]HPR76110.1 hypothetical protein [Oscillospiraceae bacterium]
MLKHKKGTIFGFAVLLAALTVSGCIGPGGLKSEQSTQTESTGSTQSVVSTVESNVKTTEGANEYISEQYGFAFTYNQLLLTEETEYDEFVSLTHLSGDKAVVKIQEPEFMSAEEFEEWLKTAWQDNDPEITVYRREEMTLKGYPALLVEISRTILGQQLRTIDLIALKDGYRYDLIVTMQEEYVEDVRTEFDVVVASFRLLSNKVDLGETWKRQMPDDFPYDIITLAYVEDMNYTMGDLDSRFSIAYFSEASKDDLKEFYLELMQNAQELEIDYYDITGAKGGYEISIEIDDGYLTESKVKIVLTKID